MPTLPEVPKPKIATGSTRALVVLFFVNILNFYDRQAPGAIMEPIRKEFGLSDTQIGFMTTAFTLLYAVVGLPIGRLADRSSRKNMLAAGIGLWGALTGTAALAANYTMLLFSRLGVSVGEAVCAPAATSWLGDLFPPHQRARAIALFMLGVPIGGQLSAMIGGPIAQSWGWRAAMVAAALPALFLIPFVLTLREPERGASETKRPAASLKPPSAMSVLRIPTLWWIIASGALVNFILYVLATFVPSFLVRFHKLSVSDAGFWTGITHLLAGVAGALTAGMLGDRVIHKSKNGRLLLAAAAMLISAPIQYVGILQPAGSGFPALFWFAASYGFLNMYYGLVYACIQDIVPPSLRATTMSIYFMAMYLCGASFGPVIAGSLSDRMARSAAAAAGSPVVTEAFKAVGLHDALYIVP
ncbi:MAG: MFS transporter, partial [Bryobacterales bacterium]|nr:MFS transporter [Bryobacterales bacterium]